MAKKSKIVDALSPLDAIISVLATLGIVVTIVVALSAAIGQDVTIFGTDRDSLCIDSTVTSSNNTPLNAEDRSLLGLNDGVSPGESVHTACLDNPGATDRILAGLSNAPTVIVFFGFLLLTRRTIRFARRNGLFSQVLARRVERLGWLLLLGLLGAATIEWLADGHLQARLLTYQSWNSGSFSVSVAGIIGAYGIISIGRVMSRAADLQADVDGTV